MIEIDDNTSLNWREDIVGFQDTYFGCAIDMEFCVDLKCREVGDVISINLDS